MHPSTVSVCVVYLVQNGNNSSIDDSGHPLHVQGLSATAYTGQNTQHPGQEGNQKPCSHGFHPHTNTVMYATRNFPNGQCIIHTVVIKKIS